MAVDPYWTNVVLLLRMDGANNSTVWVDESPSPKTITIAAGSPKVSTDRFKFGGASTYFNNAEGLSAGTSSDFTFGTGDFTIECWAYFTATTLSTLTSLWSNWTWYKNGGNSLALYDHNSATDIMSAPISLNEWHHCALTRKGNVLYMHIDGVLVATTAYSISISSSNFLIGINAPVDAKMNGYIDELRVTSGVGRYTASFDHPLERFPTGTEPTPVMPELDSDFDKVSLLLRGGGREGSRIITDSSPSQKAPPWVYGDARNRVAQSHAGPSSIYFDGSGDGVLYPYSADLQLPGDFTIDFWIYPLTKQGFIFNCGGGISIGWASYEMLFVGTYLYFAGSSANAGYDIGSEGVGNDGRVGIPTSHEWSHVAITCEGNTYRGFLNGALGFTQTVAAHPRDTDKGIVIGGTFSNIWGSTPNSSMLGYLEDFRITNGKARWVAPFTPPAFRAPIHQGTISGTVRDSADALASAEVCAYDGATRELVSRGVSDPATGAYELPTRSLSPHIVVIDPPGSEVLPRQAKVYNGVLPVVA